MRFIYLIFIFFCLPVSAASTESNLYFEQALYEHLQGNYLNAITLSEVLTEKTNQSDIKQQVLLSSSYFNYRLPQVSLDILSNELGIESSKADQDILYFHIAKNYYDNQQFELSLDAFKQIKAPINPAIVDRLNYLMADLTIRKNDLKHASTLANKLKGHVDYFPFVAHNLAIAYLNAKDINNALIWIKQLNDKRYTNHNTLKDSLLLSSGIFYLREKNYTQAIDLLLQIKKESSFSAKGLLALGTALVLNNKLSDGTRFYNYLSNYPKQNIYYQESLLKLAESNTNDAAKQLFEHAISQYNDLLDQVSALAQDNKDTEISACLVNATDNLFCQNIHLWIDELEHTSLFKAKLTQHKQLLNIQRTLFEWSQKIPVYQFILTQRKNDFDNKLPTIKNNVNPAQLATLNQQFVDLKAHIEEQKNSHSPFAFINEDESDQLEDINYVEVSIKRINKESIQDLTDRAQFAKGILMWDLSQQKPSRLRQITKNLNELERLLKTSKQGMAKLKHFNDFGDIRLSQLSDTLQQAEQSIEQLNDKVEQLINDNKQQLSTLTRHYLLQRRATLIRFNSRSKYLLTQLQDIQK